MEVTMIDELFHLFEKEFSLKVVSEVLAKVKELVELFGEEYLKDKNFKDAGIDAVIKLLEEMKDKTSDAVVAK